MERSITIKKEYLKALTIAIILFSFPFAIMFESNLIMPFGMILNLTLLFIFRDEKDRQSPKKARLYMLVLVLGYLIIFLLYFEYMVVAYAGAIISIILLILSLFIDNEEKQLSVKNKLLLAGGLIFLVAIILMPFISISVIVWLFIAAIILIGIAEKRRVK